MARRPPRKPISTPHGPQGEEWTQRRFMATAPNPQNANLPVPFPILITDFEDGDLTEWGGETGGFFIDNTAPVKHGSLSLKSTTDNQSMATVTGLPRYPQQGDEWRWNVQMSTKADDSHITNYAAQAEVEAPNSYHYDVRDDDVRLRLNDGNISVLASATNVGYQAGEFLEEIVAWGTDDSHQLTMDAADGTQLAQLSASDATFTSGGIGVSTGPETTTDRLTWDWFRVTGAV